MDTTLPWMSFKDTSGKACPWAWSTHPPVNKTTKAQPKWANGAMEGRRGCMVLWLSGGGPVNTWTMPKIGCHGPIPRDGPSDGQQTVQRICIFGVMKNLSFPLVFGLLFSWMMVFQVSAQIEFVNPPDTVYVALDTLGTGALEVHWDVVNNGNGPVELMVTRFLVDTVSPFNYPYIAENEGAHERFCWGPSCFQYGTDASPNNPAFFVSLDSAETDTTFRGDYVPYGVTGPTTIRYCFHPPGQISSGVCHQVTYFAVETASLGEAVVRPFEGFELWPNPAQDVCN